MQCNFHGGAKIEQMETEETCTMQPYDFYCALFEWKSRLHFCDNLGKSCRVPPMTSFLQWERMRSFFSDKDIRWFWVLIHDKQNEGQWRDFYNNQVLNFTTPWFTGEPNGGSGQNCAASLNGAWYDEPCELKHACLCERQRSYHMRLRGLCADSAVDKYYQPINNFSDFARLTLVGQRGSTIEYDVNNNNWKLSLAGSNVSGLSYASQST